MKIWTVVPGVALCGCTAGDRYVIPPATLATIEALSPAEREKTVVVAHVQRTGQAANVRANAFSLREAVTRPDGQIAIPTRLRSKRIILGSTLVWVGTPLSIAGVAMIIALTGAPRYAGIAIAGVAEPVMDVGTYFWVKGVQERKQEVPPGLANLNYLPEPGIQNPSPEAR